MKKTKNNFKNSRHYQFMRKTGNYGNPFYWGWFLEKADKLRAKLLTGLLAKKRAKRL